MGVKTALTKYCCALVLVAKTISLFAEDNRVEEVISIASRVDKPANEVPGNQSVINSDALKMLAHTHIQQALNQLPGVGVQRNNGQEYLPAIRSPVLSGAGACGSILMAEDGIPLRPAGFCNINELFEAHTEQALRIEVIRGPGSSLYGSNALHGLVNIVAPARFQSALQLGLEAGPNDYSRVRASWGSETFALAFTGSHDGGYRDDSGVDQQKISLRHLHQGSGFTTTTGLTMVHLNQETAGFIQGFNAYKNARLAQANLNPEAFRDAQAVRLWARLEARGDQPAWVVTPYIRHSNMDFLQHFLPGQPLEKNGHTSLGVQSAVYRYSLQSHLIIGMDLEFAQSWLQQVQEGLTLGSDFLRETIPQGRHYDYTVGAYQLGPFIHWEWSPNPVWTVTAGARYESMHYDYNNHMIDGRTRDDGSTCGFGGCRYTRPADREDHFDNWSPRLGVLVNVSEEHQIYASLSRGFRAPQTAELYRLQQNQTVADLDSEQLNSFELGVRGQTKSLGYELTAYGMKKDNYIFRDSDFFNVSKGQTTHRGIELSLHYDMDDNWDLNIAATAAKHRYHYSQILGGIDIDGNDVDTAPHHFGSARLGWHDSKDLKIELEWVRMGSYFTDAENLHRYQGHDILNLRGRWRLLPFLTLSGRLLNLLNTRYADRADYTNFSGDRYLPGEPRSLYVGVEYHW